MTDPSNKALADAIIQQQKDVGELSKVVSTLATSSSLQGELSVQIQQQIAGICAAFEVFAELAMASSPELKHRVAVTTSQALAKTELDNQMLRDLLTTLNRSATSESRDTPEGRRTHFKVIPGGESDNGGDA